MPFTSRRKAIHVTVNKSHAGRAYRVGGEKWDVDIVRGASSATAVAGQQAVLARAYDTGNVNGMAGTALGTTLTAIFTTHGVTDTNDMRKFGFSTLELDLVNITNIALECDLYILACGQDSTTGISTDLPTLFNEYMTEYDTTANYLTLGVTPYQAYGFTNVWRPVRKFHFNMDAGAKRSVNIKHPLFHDWCRAQIGQNIEAAAPRFSIRGCSYAWMAIFKGQICADTTTPSQFNTAPVALAANWVWKMFSAISNHTDINTTLITNSTDPLQGNGSSTVIDETGVVASVDYA